MPPRSGAAEKAAASTGPAQAGWRLRLPQPLRLLLPAAVAMPLLVMAASAGLAWRQAWREAEVEASRTAEAAAEYAARVLDANARFADQLNDMLRGLSDAEIRARGADLHLAMRLELERRAQLLKAAVFDRDGVPLISANMSPVPRDAVSDSDFFTAQQAADAPAYSLGRLNARRSDGALFFSVSRRRTETGNQLPPGAFDGIVMVAVQTNELAAGLRRLLPQEPGLEKLALIRADGEVLSRSVGMEHPLPRVPLGSRFIASTAGGQERAIYYQPSDIDGELRLAALRRVDGWPVYAAAGRPRAAVLARWREIVISQAAIGLPAALALFGLVLVIRRGQRDLAQANHGLEQRVELRTAALAESERRLRLAQQAGGIGTWELDFDRGQTTLDDGLLALYGLPREAVAKFRYADWLAMVHPEDRTRLDAETRAALRSKSGYTHEFRVVRADTGAIRWLQLRCRRVPAAGGRGPRLLGVNIDVTERREAEERLRLLAREVDHRAKNALSVVQAAVRLTPKQEPEAFAKAIEGRVRALAWAQTLLAEAHWEGVGLHDLVKGELTAFLTGGGTDGGVRLSGPAVTLTPLAAQPLAMALHELATNAVKYGALSAAGGHLTLSWRLDEAAGLLWLHWVEQGGPAILAPPQRRGFGSRVLEATIRDQLGGRAERRWQESGLVCELLLPLARVLARVEPGSAGAHAPLAI
jgi:PAS domain S-box-containing protein